MSEVSHEVLAGKQPEGYPNLQRAGEDLAYLLQSFDAYGPIRIRTRVPNIPGIEYDSPLRGDENRNPIAHITHKAIRVVADEARTNVFIQTSNELPPFDLPLSGIEKVGIDHPLGNIGMPLLGSDIPPVGITVRDEEPVVRWHDRFIEHGWRNRIDVENHARYPGITIIRNYEAIDRNLLERDAPRDTPTLAEVQEAGTTPGVFLMSKINSERYIVTSRLGGPKTTPVIVRRPKVSADTPLPHLQIEMLDMQRDTPDDHLLDLHLKRYNRLANSIHNTPTWPMKPYEIDSVFVYMTHD